MSQSGPYISEPIRICENNDENNSPNFKTVRSLNKFESHNFQRTRKRIIYKEIETDNQENISKKKSPKTSATMLSK